MNESVNINIRADLDASGLSQLRAALSKSKTEIQEVSKSLNKSSNEFKINKEAVKELTRITKLSDKELQKYANSLREVSSASNQIGNATGGFSKMSSMFSSLQSTLGQLGIAYGISEIVQGFGRLSVESVKAAAEFEQLRSGFIGTSKDIELFRSATSYTVSKGDLIKLSNQASDLGITLQDQALLFSLSEDAADKYGGSIEENFMKIVQATDGSAKGLRMVGISVSSYKEELQRLADQQGINIEKMDSEEALGLRLQAIYNLTGVSVDSLANKQVSLADKIDALSAAAEDAKVAFGEGIISGFESLGKTMMFLINNVFPNFQDTFIGLANTIKDNVPRLLGSYMSGGFIGLVGSIINPPPKEPIPMEPGTEAGKQEYLKYKPLLDKLDKKDKDKGTKGAIKQKQTDKDLLDELLKNQKLELDLLKAKHELTLNDLYLIRSQIENGKSLIKNKEDELQLLQAIANVNKEIDDITSTRSMEAAKINNSVNRQPISFIGKYKEFSADELSQYRSENFQLRFGNLQEVNELSGNVFNNLSQTLSLLGVETDSWASKVIAVFQTTSSLMQFGKGFLGLLSYIPGLNIFAGFRAEGGAVDAGRLYMTGERGAELFMPSQKGYIFNNNDSRDILNALSSGFNGNNSNVFISANINDKYISYNIEKRNRFKNYYKVA